MMIGLEVRIAHDITVTNFQQRYTTIRLGTAKDLAIGIRGTLTDFIIRNELHLESSDVSHSIAAEFLHIIAITAFHE